MIAGKPYGALWGAGMMLILGLVSAAALPAHEASAADSSQVVTSGTPSRDSVPQEPQKPLAQPTAGADSLLKKHGGSPVNDAQLFLSWDAPWGQKRAHRERRPACADSTREDTLYLCMTMGQASEEFEGFTAELMVRAVANDTLGAWWHMQGKGGQNPGAMRVEWAALQDWGVPQPFRQQGQGFILLEPARSVAKIRLIFAVPTEPAATVEAGKVYALARITLRHMPARGLPGCASPVVIEWTKATFAFRTQGEPAVARGERFVTYSGPYLLSEQFRGLRTQTWKPPAPAKK